MDLSLTCGGAIATPVDPRLHVVDINVTAAVAHQPKVTTATDSNTLQQEERQWQCHTWNSCNIHEQAMSHLELLQHSPTGNVTLGTPATFTNRQCHTWNSCNIHEQAMSHLQLLQRSPTGNVTLGTPATFMNRQYHTCNSFNVHQQAMSHLELLQHS